MIHSVILIVNIRNSLFMEYGYYEITKREFTKYVYDGKIGWRKIDKFLEI